MYRLGRRFDLIHVVRDADRLDISLTPLWVYRFDAIAAQYLLDRL